MDEILDDQRKLGRVKSDICRMKPFKHSVSQDKRPGLDLLSQVRPGPGVHPPFAAALSTSSLAQLPIDPQLHVAARAAADRRKEVPGIHREPGQRTLKPEEDLYLSSEEAAEKRGVRDIEKMVSGRKASKKHRSK